MRELNIGTFTGILTTSESTSVVDILRILLSRKISAIPIVSNTSLSGSGAASDGPVTVSVTAPASSSPTLCGLFSTSDVKSLMLNSLRSDLEMPVRDFLRRRNANEDTRPLYHPPTSSSSDSSSASSPSSSSFTSTTSSPFPYGTPTPHGTSAFAASPSSPSGLASPFGGIGLSSSPVITCTRDDTLKTVLSKLVLNKIHRLVVVKEDNNRIDGIVSVNDILRFFTSIAN